jgi:arginyl-tRNA synthetase
MSNIAKQLEQHFRTAIKSVFGVDADPLVGASQQEQFADYQSNAAMSLAKTLGKKPREIAEQIKAKLELAGMAQEVAIAGPGFINVKLSHAWIGQELQKLLGDKRLGVTPVAAPETVVVDYSGPNVAKEMHVGHLRSTIIGDAVARVLQGLGHRILPQNHIGDWGTQFGMLIEFLFERFPVADIASRSLAIGDLNVFYQDAKKKFDADPEFADRARKRVVLLQAGDAASRQAWSALRFKSLDHFDSTYNRLSVLINDKPVEYTRGESDYNSDLASVVADLKQSGLAVESDGATVVFIDGPEKAPMIVQKSDGGYLYSTTDLAAIRYRIKVLHAQRIVYVHDSRQAHHFRQLFAVARRTGWAEGVELDYAPFGTMLGEDGTPFKTRSGGTVKLKDLLDEAEKRAEVVVTSKNPNLPDEQKKAIAHAVGIGAVKYADLAKDRISDYVFSFDKILSLDGNTAPYLQYAHARIQSILNKAHHGETTEPDRAGSFGSTGSPQAADAARLSLESPFEVSLGKHILRYPEVVDAVARDLKPHLLCTYLYDLAVKFSGFYENCPVIQSEGQTRASRLALCELTAGTLKLGLDLLGIQCPYPM